MIMKKIIFLSLLLLILTGCDVQYELEFNDEILNETIQVTLDKSMEREIEQIKNRQVYAIFNSYDQNLYNTDYNEGLTNFRATYTYTYQSTNFNQSLFNNNCFDAFSFVKQKNNYILSTSEGFKCMTVEYFPIENLDITLTTNHEVIETNADKVEGKKYIWEINDDNADEKEIYIKFGEVRKRNFFERIIDYINENKFIFIVVGIIVLLLGASVTTIVIISKKNNEI